MSFKHTVWLLTDMIEKFVFHSPHTQWNSHVTPIQTNTPIQTASSIVSHHSHHSHHAVVTDPQSIGFLPFSTKYAFAFEKCRQPTQHSSHRRDNDDENDNRMTHSYTNNVEPYL
jgi:hypothetical protein